MKEASNRQAADDPLSQLVKNAVMAALDETGKPLSRRLMTTAQAAEYLGISEDSVRNLNAARKLKCCRIVGVKLMFDVRDLDRLIEDSKE